MPAKADLAAQEAFVKDFEAFLMSAISKQEVVYFVDAVHPQHNTRSAYVWIAKGSAKEIPSNSGRARLNLNGAINVENPTEVLIREDKCINAQITWDLYQDLGKKHPNKDTIYVICDNARYYKNKVLQAKLKNSKIKQVFLPFYSPNLNLIERLWKFLRKKVIDYEFYEDFQQFRKSIFNFFDHIDDYQKELEKLIAWNFHIPKSTTNFY